MNNIQKRFILFLLGCIGTRSLLVYLAKILDKKYLKYMGFITLIPAFGFLYLYLTDSRKSGREVFGSKIWWNELRVFHGLLYLLFSIYAIKEKNYAWIVLLVDVSFGLISFLIFHYISGNFSKLF